MKKNLFNKFITRVIPSLAQQSVNLNKEEQDVEFSQYFVPAFTYKALNRMVQGSAADMTKKAMVLLYEKGIIPHIQIHDELCVSVKNNLGDTIKEVMETAVPLKINNKVDCAYGSSWGATSEE